MPSLISLCICTVALRWQGSSRMSRVMIRHAALLVAMRWKHYQLVCPLWQPSLTRVRGAVNSLLQWMAMTGWQVCGSLVKICHKRKMGLPCMQLKKTSLVCQCRMFTLMTTQMISQCATMPINKVRLYMMRLARCVQCQHHHIHQPIIWGPTG